MRLFQEEAVAFDFVVTASSDCYYVTDVMTTAMALPEVELPDNRACNEVLFCQRLWCRLIKSFAMWPMPAAHTGSLVTSDFSARKLFPIHDCTMFGNYCTYMCWTS